VVNVTGIAGDAGANAICDGYVVFVENGSCPADGAPLGNIPPSVWSDVLVFHDGTTIPQAADGGVAQICGAAINATLISDVHLGVGFPASGPIAVAPDGGPSAAYGLLPANLASLDAPTIINAPTTVCVNQKSRYLAPDGGQPGSGPQNGANYAANGTTYGIISDVPALPPWAFLLLGGTLLGTAALGIRGFRGRSIPSA
jgi:hypothetical protein